MTPFDYEKRAYDITLPNGKIVRCWPNAGTWHALEGSGRIFQWAQIVDAVPVKDEDR